MATRNDPWSSYKGSSNENGSVTANSSKTTNAFGSRWSRFGFSSQTPGNEQSSKPQHFQKDPSSKFDKKVQNSLFAKYEKSRASKISVTVVKPKKSSKWGIGIVPDSEDDQVIIIKAITNNGLLSNVPFKEGDILKTVNNQPCKNGEKTIQKLSGYDGGTPITLIAEATSRGNSKLVQAMVKKPSLDALVGIGFYNIQHQGSSLLIINHLDPMGLLAYSTLSQGDLVLSINGESCSQLKSDEASEIIKDSGKAVNIVALRAAALQQELNPSRLTIFKRAMGSAVGALFGGSTPPAASAKQHTPTSGNGDYDDEIPAASSSLSLTRTESGSNSQYSASESRALDMVHDHPMDEMDDTLSEVSFTDTDNEEDEISSVFSAEIDEIIES